MRRQGSYHRLLKPPPDKPLKHQISEMIKAIEGGDDSQVKEALLRMEKEEVDYLLQHVYRLRALLSGRLKVLTKRRG